MRITFLMIGKTNQQYLDILIQDYQKRIRHYVHFDSVVIPELKNTKNLSVLEQKEKEADLILKQFEEQDEIILLDENGILYPSRKFADFIANKMLYSTKKLVFVVGGPYGFAPRVYSQATHKISMSPMTFSHQMIRLIFAEQLYRAFTIIKGENYHHD